MSLSPVVINTWFLMSAQDSYQRPSVFFLSQETDLDHDLGLAANMSRHKKSSGGFNVEAIDALYRNDQVLGDYLHREGFSPCRPALICMAPLLPGPLPAHEHVSLLSRLSLVKRILFISWLVYDLVPAGISAP